MIKYADEIVKEIEQRGAIKIPNGNVSGEEFERWLYGNGNFLTREKIAEDCKGCKDILEMSSK